MLEKITEKNYDVILDLKYAETDNFAKRKLYKTPSCFLHKDAALLLNKACFIANDLGYKIKIFDAYRPVQIQEIFWNIVPDNNFVSNPKTGAIPHSRGVAIDITLIDKKTNEEIFMGTEFDHFSPKAFHNNREVSIEARKNRYLLLGIMSTAGWDFFQNEWWHYQLFKPREYQVIKDAKINELFI